MTRKAWPNLEQFLFYKCIDKKKMKYVQGDRRTDFELKNNSTFNWQWVGQTVSGFFSWINRAADLIISYTVVLLQPTVRSEKRIYIRQRANTRKYENYIENNNINVGDEKTTDKALIGSDRIRYFVQ